MISAGVFLGLCLAGGLGAATRFVLDGLLRARKATTLPWATIVINLTGSFALGLLTGLMLAGLVPGDWKVIIGTGFLGGYTTFSTASIETIRLLQQGEYGRAALNGFGVVAAATVCAAVGLWLGLLI